MDARFIIDARLPDGRRPSLERWAEGSVQLTGESLPGWLATLISGHEGSITLTVQMGPFCSYCGKICSPGKRSNCCGDAIYDKLADVS